MTTTTKNQSYTSTVAKNNLIEELHRKTRIVNDLVEVLTQHGELPTLATMREYQLKGADHKRVAVIDELETYIKKVGMPAYLQESARAEALKQVNNRLISEVGDVLDGIDFELTSENLEYNDGRHEWKFTEAFTATYLAPSLKTLTDEQQADFEALIGLLRGYESLKEHGYNVINIIRNGNTDAPLDELAERFVGWRGAIDTAWMGACTPAPETPAPQLHE